MNLKILFIGKKDDFFSKIAAEYLSQNIMESTIIFSAKGDKIPDDIYNWKGDYIISYLAQWIIPGSMLENAAHGGINLHPGSPDYPGIGCTNFAIYNEEKIFGITCHYMLPKVDTGKIIMVERFSINENDTVFTLTQRAYSAILHTFYKLIDILVAGNKPQFSDEEWTRKPYTRKELNELCEIKLDMSDEEKNRRIKSTTFGTQKWAFIKSGEDVFIIK